MASPALGLHVEETCWPHHGGVCSVPVEDDCVFLGLGFPLPKTRWCQQTTGVLGGLKETRMWEGKSQSHGKTSDSHRRRRVLETQATGGRASPRCPRDHGGQTV